MEDSISQDLHQLALRMRREMPCKERTIHLHNFKWTFNGQQAASYLLTHGIVQDAQAAVELCQRMLQQGLFKSIYHKELFTADSEIYRFSSSMLDNKHKGLTGLTSTGLYKEIAKFGKAAAQPFKQVSVQLNDTFANLGSLSAVAPKLGGISAINTNGATGSAAAIGTAGSQLRQLTPLRLGKLQTVVRRSQTGVKHDAAAGNHADDEPEGFAEVITQLQALQGSIKESSGLLRIDLQQHTALQEHLVGLLMAQQRHNQVMQALAAVIAAAASLLLAAAGGAPLWPAQLVGWALLSAVVVLVAPRLLEAVPDSIAVFGMLGRAAQPAEGPLDTCRTLMPQPSNKGAPKLDRVSLQASIAAEAGSGADSAASEEAAGSGSDSGVETDWEEMGPSLQDFDDWPDAPVMMCPDPSDRQQSFVCDTLGPCQALPLNSGPIPFESELFRGVVAVYVRHLNSTPSHMFKGKKRLIWIALQGTFKRPVSMDSLVFGQEFSRKLCNLPAPWFIGNMLLPLARKISPALRVGNLEQPYLYSPLITASQIVNVSMPGFAPQLMEAKEDASLITGDLLSVAARRKHFQSAAHRTATSFTTEHVWTFHLWQEYLDFASYLLNLSYSSYDLTQHLDGQPLQVMVKDVSCAAHLVNLHVWHSNLVRSSQRHLHRPPTRMRSSNRLGADVQDDSSSTRVTGGGVAPMPPSESFSPASMAASHPRISDAGTAVTVGTLGTETGSRQEVDEAEQLLLQAQSPVASARGIATTTESPSSLQEEHWFDARYSHPQQESPEIGVAPLSRQQQQAEQQMPWLETLEQQTGQQQQAKQQQQQRQRQRPSSFSNAYPAAAAAAGEQQQQHARSFSGTGKQPQQQQQSPRASSQSAAGASRDAAAASEVRLLGLRASQLKDEEPGEAPTRSGGSASSAISSPQDSSRQLKSMRSL